MASDWYQALFETRLASPREPLAELATTCGGFRMATSVGGVLTGRGADVILIDDPLKPADAMSQSRRAAANDWFDSTLYSRLNDKQKGAIVIVMQRLHEDDLAGHVLGQGGWDVVSFPAVAEEDEAHAFETPLAGAWAFRRSAGEALDPAREPLPALERIRATIGEMNFAAQYQQRPAPAGGGMIKAAWLQRFRLADPPPFDRIVQSWDTANKPSELSDYSVCTTWGVKGPRFYLLNVLRKKLSYPELRRAVVEQNRLFRPQTIVIEDRASGTQLIQDLIGDGLSHVARFSPDGDKIMRLHAQTAVIENGFVFLPEEAPWLADYVSELTAFPAGRWDDQVELDRAVPRMGEEEAPSGVVHSHDGPLWGAGVEGEVWVLSGRMGPCGRSPSGLGPYYICTSQTAVRTPSPAALGKVARSAGWGVARCMNLSQIARTSPRTFHRRVPVFRTPVGAA